MKHGSQQLTPTPFDTDAMLREEILLRPARRAVAFCAVVALLFAGAAATGGGAGDDAHSAHDAIVEHFVRSA